MLFQPINDLKRNRSLSSRWAVFVFCLDFFAHGICEEMLISKKALWDQPQGFFNDICTKQFSQQRRDEHIYAPIAFSVSLTRSDASASVAAVEKRNPDSASI